MAKTTRKRASKMDRKLTKPTHRVNTHPANGSASTSTQVAPPGRRGRPRQQDLPGTEDRAIQAIEEKAADYADVRDRRMALNTAEADLKGDLLTLMKQYNKTVYKRDGVEIEVVPKSTEETVKVKLKKADDDPVADGDEATD